MGIKLPGKLKMKNVPTIYKGRNYASKIEAARAAELDVLKDVGEIIHWEPQVRFRNLGDGTSSYTVDFVVFEKYGIVHAEEVKGMEHPWYKMNKRKWGRFGPCDLVIIKSANGHLYTDEVLKGGLCER